MTQEADKPHRSQALENGIDIEDLRSLLGVTVGEVRCGHYGEMFVDGDLVADSDGAYE